MSLGKSFWAGGLLACVLGFPGFAGVYLPQPERVSAPKSSVVAGTEESTRPRADKVRTPVAIPLPEAGEEGPAPDKQQKHYRAEQVLPEDTYVFVSVNSPAQLWEQVKKLHVYGALNEPLLGPRLKGLFSSFQEAFEPGKADPRSFTGMLGKAGFTPLRMLESLGGQAAFAVRTGRKGTNTYLIVDVQGAKANIREMVDEFVSQVKAKHQEVFIDPKIYKDYARVNFTLTDGSSYSYTYIGNLLIVGVGEEAVEEIIDQVVAGAARPLAESDSFMQPATELGEVAAAFYYVRVPRLLGILSGRKGGPGLPAGLSAQQITAMSGLLGNLGVAAGAAFTLEGGVRDRIVLTAYDPAKPIVSGFTLRELRQKVTSFAPLDSILYITTYIDAAQAYKSMMQQIELTQPDAAGMLKAALRDLERKVGQGFLPLFKGEAGLIIARSARRHTPDMVFVIETVDGERVRQVIESLRGEMGTSLVRTSVGRATVWYYQPAGSAGDSSAAAVRPAVAIVDDFVIFGSSDDVVAKVVRQKRFAASNLTQNTNYRLATRDLPQGSSMLVFVDLPQLVNVVYDYFLVVTSGMKEEEVAQIEKFLGIKFDMLPTPEAVAAHMVPVAQTVRMSENKLYVDLYGPLGSLAVPTAAAAMYSPQIGESLSQRSQEILEQRMQTIGLGLHLYAADFDRFPVNLSELYPDNYVTERDVFMAPTGKRQVFAKDDIDTDSDFVYVRGVRLNDLSETIILYTKSYVHKGEGRTVLLLAPIPQRLPDGRLVYKSVRYMPETEFRTKMAEQGHEVKD